MSPHVRPLGDTNCLHCPPHSDTSLDACSSGTLPSVYKTARRHFPNEDKLTLVVLLFWGFIILSAIFVWNSVTFCCPCGVPFVRFCAQHLISAVGHVLLHANCWGVDRLSLPGNRVRCSDNHSCFLDTVCCLGFFKPLKPSGYHMYRQCKVQQLHVQPTQCIYVSCVDLGTNSDYFPIQH